MSKKEFGIRTKESSIKKYDLKCFECGTTLEVDDDCGYYCPHCDYFFANEFALVKECLREYGVTEAYKVSKITGVSMHKLNYYLRKGMVEIANCSKVFIHCDKCGADIKYGNYCPNCARILAPLAAKDDIEIDMGELAPVKKKPGSGMLFVDKAKGRGR